MSQRKAAFADLASGLALYLEGDLTEAFKHLSAASQQARVSRFAKSSLPSDHDLDKIIRLCSLHLPDQQCEGCGGLGYIDCGTCLGSGWSTCARCRGEGTVKERTRSRSPVDGRAEVEIVSVECPDCRGLGVNLCTTCQGSGTVPCPQCGQAVEDANSPLSPDISASLFQTIAQAEFVAAGGLDLFSPEGLATSPAVADDRPEPPAF